MGCNRFTKVSRDYSGRATFYPKIECPRSERKFRKTLTNPKLWTPKICRKTGDLIAQVRQIRGEIPWTPCAAEPGPSGPGGKRRPGNPYAARRKDLSRPPRRSSQTIAPSVAGFHSPIGRLPTPWCGRSSL